MTETTEEKTVEKKRSEKWRQPKKPQTFTPRPIQKTTFVGDCKDLTTCVFDCQDYRQSGDFEATIDHLANYAGNLYGGEIRKLIKDFAPIVFEPPADLPADPPPSATTQKIWELDIAAFVKKRNKLVDDVRKLYSLIWGQCTDLMKSKLEAMDSFKSFNDNQDSLALLISIKALVYKFDDRKYPAYNNIEATVKLYRFYQGKEMSTNMYLERFKNMVSVIEHYGGSVGKLPHLVKEEIARASGSPYDPVKKYDKALIASAKNTAKEKSLACLFLNGADKSRYGDMLVELHNDYLKGTSNYPTTLKGAYELMINWHSKTNNKTDQVQYGSSFAQDNPKPSGLACWGCGKPGTHQQDCINPECATKWKEKLARKAGQAEGRQHLNMITEQSSDTADEQHEDFSINEYAGYSFYQGQKIGEGRILLDNQSTHSTFYSHSLVTNIRKAPHTIKMLANGGTIVYDKIADLAGYGTVWFNKNAIANIISMAEAESKGYEITYSPGCFKVTNTLTNRITRFHRTNEGLYAHDIHLRSQGTSFIQTVRTNEARFTPRQVRKAREAQLLYEMVGRPSLKDYLAIIKNNMLPNVAISVSDIIHAEAIYRKDLGAIQGKTTRTTPNHVAIDYVNVPPDILEFHRDVAIAADIFYVGGIAFFITTSRNIQFTTVEKLESRKENVLINAIIKVANLYHRRGFNVVVFLMDNEFQVLRGTLLTKGIALNTCAPDEHVPEIERKIRTVKERIRGLITTLPFDILPTLLIVHSVIFSVMWLNFFPPAGGISPTISPQTIITGLSADGAKHCRIPFGGYAQVHAEPHPTNNAMVSRTVGGISLGPTGNIQGTYKFLSLLTGRQIQARAFTPLPMPTDVIRRVEALATHGIPKITFENRAQLPLPDAWQTNDDPEEEYHDANAYEYQHEDDISLDVDSESSNNTDTSTPNTDNEGVETNESNGTDYEINTEESNSEESDAEESDAEESNPEDENEEDSENLSEAEQDNHTEGVEEDDIQGVEEEEEEDDIEGVEEEELEDTNVEEGENEGVEDGTTNSPNRTRTITRSGRESKIRRDLAESYVLTQQAVSPSTQTPSIQQTFGIRTNLDRVDAPSNDMILQYAFTQYSLKQGLKQFPKEAKEATIAEMKQLHDMSVFKPVHKSLLTNQEILHTLGSLLFIKQKRCGRIKARACADGRPQRLLYDKADASSPTVKTESVILTSIIDAAERREVAVYDIPGAFLHSELPDTVHMKVVGELAKLLIQVDPGSYEEYVVQEKGKDVIYLLLTRSLYGCLKSAIQFWKHLSGNLLDRGYVLNPYDPCVANKDIDGSQFTITWHVDDLKMSHKSGETIDAEVKWLETIYGPLVGTRGNQHTYLGMDLDFTVNKNGELMISMIPYLQETIDEFPEALGKPASTPASNFLFDESEKPVPLDDEKAKVFHHTVAKLLWAAMRARPDLLTALSFLTSRVQSPDEDDNKKLKRLLSYLQATINLPLRLSADGSHVIKWWVDASFATRKEMRSQTGAMMSMGKGGIYNMSRKQGLTTKSSTEAELVGADDVMPQLIWTRHFLLSQGVNISQNILFQDNKSAMLLEKNGTGSSSRRTRHINIRFYFIKDRIASDELELQYCPTDQMIGDFFTKPLQGAKFLFFRRLIMGEHNSVKS